MELGMGRRVLAPLKPLQLGWFPRRKGMDTGEAMVVSGQVTVVEERRGFSFQRGTDCKRFQTWR